MKPAESKKHTLVAILILTVSISIGSYFIYSQSSFSIFKKKIDPQAREAYITGVLTTCVHSQYRNRCLKAAAQDFLNQFSLPEILPVLRKNEKSESYFTTCHQLAHYMGQEEYLRLKSVSKVYAEADETCLGGIYHGTIEGYFMAKNIMFDGTPEMDIVIGKEVQKVCGKEDDYVKISEFGSCNHGLGHALMYVTDNDLPRALKLCDYLDTVNNREICYTGALMQNYSSIGDVDHPAKYARINDPMYPCYILDKTYQGRCYSYGVLTNFQAQPEKAIELCNSIPSDYRNDCFETYGRDRTMVSFVPSEIKEQCDLIQNSAFMVRCVNAAAANLVTRFGLTSKLGIELCSLQAVGINTTCYANLIGISRTLSRKKDELLLFCNQLPDAAAKERCITQAEFIGI